MRFSSQLELVFKIIRDFTLGLRNRNRRAVAKQLTGASSISCLLVQERCSPASRAGPLCNAGCVRV